MVIIPIAPIEHMDFTRSVNPIAQEARQVELPFESVLQNAIGELNKAQAVSEADAYRLALGNTDNLHQIQIDSMKTEAMLNTTVQLTTRLVNAYKEVMQMQV